MTERRPPPGVLSDEGRARYDFTVDDIRETRVVRVLALWEAKRGQRRFPARADFRPEELGFALGKLALYEVHRDPLRFRYRLVGTETARRAGFDPTGRWLDEEGLREFNRVVLQRLTMLAQDPRPLLVHNRQVCEERWVDYEAIWLPLAADGVNLDMFMVCHVTQER